ncbi:MAG: alpha/beta fold hydrolase [Candidatus Omnitrophota bacterium]|nr:alpha/beta fold hydrolase [Candidatus Omnitrophota bacterium]MDZ4241942.1 alpha/beta fold hydrolase [Candidatus Omnitrophota bacterium]
MKKKLNIVSVLFLLFFFGTIAGIAWLCVKPIPTETLVSSPSWFMTYEESVERVKAMYAQDGADIADNGHLILLSHGKKTPNAIVFFHGSTNSPRQFADLGKIFFQKGYNVFIPRIPHHGLKDRMTGDHANLTAEEMVKLCDESVDIARGLGEHVTVVGLSLGANMTSWVAQNRLDVDKAVIISPFWGWKEIPFIFWKPSVNLAATLPNMFLWWDKNEKMAFKGPQSTYCRFSTRGLGQIMRLGWCVLKQAKGSAPGTRSIVVITNALDEAVNQANIKAVVRQWQKHSNVNLTLFTFDKSYGVYHDLIDPEQPYQKTEKVYPRLISLIVAP